MQDFAAENVAWHDPVTFLDKVGQVKALVQGGKRVHIGWKVSFYFERVSPFQFGQRCVIDNIQGCKK